MRYNGKKILCISYSYSNQKVAFYYSKFDNPSPSTAPSVPSLSLCHGQVLGTIFLHIWVFPLIICILLIVYLHLFLLRYFLFHLLLYPTLFIWPYSCVAIALQDTRWIQHGDSVVAERSCWLSTRTSTVMRKWFLRLTHNDVYLTNIVVSDIKKWFVMGKWGESSTR